MREATAGGPAAAAGLRAGDVIVSVGGKAVREPDDVAAAIQDRRPGERVAIEIERGGARRTLDVRARRPAGSRAVSFQAPLLLLGLLLLPLGLAAYVLSERAAPARRRRVGRARDRGVGRAAPARLAPPRAAAALSGSRSPGLITALARPQVSVAVPAEQASIVLAMDHSGSMQATDVAPSRLAAALAAGEAFLDRVPEQGARRRRRVRPPRRGRPEPDDRPGGAPLGAARGDGAERRHRDRRGARRVAGHAAGAERARSRPPRSCCSPTASRRAGATRRPSPTRRAGSGSRSTPSRWAPTPARCPTASRCRRTPPRCRRSPSARAGKAYTAEEAGALNAVYEELGSRVAEKQEKREVTGAFAGGAIVLLAAGAARLSLRWFRRLL